MSKVAQCQSFMIEGNIGAGKSTLLAIIKEYLNVQVVVEPHKQWQNISQKYNLLDVFYKNPERWSYTFQSYAFVTRIKAQERHNKQNPFMAQIVERSVFSDRYCFAQNCFDLGYLDPLEWEIYQEWFSWSAQKLAPRPSGFIYVQTTPDVCYDRLQKRKRDEEATVSMDYINRLHDKHEQWLVQRKDEGGLTKDIPVLILQCDADFEHNKIEQEKLIQKIGEFVLSYGSIVTSQPPISSILT